MGPFENVPSLPHDGLSLHFTAAGSDRVGGADPDVGRRVRYHGR